MTHYLDHAASSPMRPAAIEAMVRVMSDHPGNPSGAHRLARTANRLVSEAREVVGSLIGVEPGDVIFTSGGTEADNLAILGLGGSVVCSAVEHPAILASVESLDGVVVGVDEAGQVDLDSLARQVAAGADLVSVMTANNETGVVTDLAAVVETVRSGSPATAIHSDAVQAAPWLDLPALTAGVDLVSVSAHKFGGPKGVGALGLGSDLALEACHLGGGQERDRRGGTHNVAGIVGMATAAAEMMAEREATAARVGAMRDRLLDGLLATVDGSYETGSRNPKLPNIAHLCFDGIESEALLFLLERSDVMAAAASSCASGAQEPSHVLAAMGVSRERAMGSLRLSLGYSSTEADVDAALAAVPPAVERLRAGGQI